MDKSYHVFKGGRDNAALDSTLVQLVLDSLPFLSLGKEKKSRKNRGSKQDRKTAFGFCPFLHDCRQ